MSDINSVLDEITNRNKVTDSNNSPNYFNLLLLGIGGYLIYKNRNYIKRKLNRINQAQNQSQNERGNEDIRDPESESTEFSDTELARE